jgi:hypothetical protein
MLKKEAMAISVAKLMLSSVIKDSSDNQFKADVLEGLQMAYIAGYDLAVTELKLDNSNPGFTMAEYLEELQDSTP